MEKIEIKRQLFHAGVGLLFVLAISLGIFEEIGTLRFIRFIPFPIVARPLFVFLLFESFLVLISKKFEIPIMEWCLEHFERPGVRKRFPGKGAFFYTLGAFLLALFFENNVVSASMLIVSVGDSTSHIIGREFGKIKHPFSSSKMLEGHIAGSLLAGFGASFFVNPPFAFIAAFLAMFLEGIEFGDERDRFIEDNLIIPLISGIIIVSLNMFV